MSPDATAARIALTTRLVESKVDQWSSDRNQLRDIARGGFEGFEAMDAATLYMAALNAGLDREPTLKEALAHLKPEAEAVTLGFDSVADQLATAAVTEANRQRFAASVAYQTSDEAIQRRNDAAARHGLRPEQIVWVEPDRPQVLVDADVSADTRVHLRTSGFSSSPAEELAACRVAYLLGDIGTYLQSKPLGTLADVPNGTLWLSPRAEGGFSLLLHGAALRSNSDMKAWLAQDADGAIEADYLDELSAADLNDLALYYSAWLTQPVCDQVDSSYILRWAEAMEPGAPSPSP